MGKYDISWDFMTCSWSIAQLLNVIYLIRNAHQLPMIFMELTLIMHDHFARNVNPSMEF